MQVHLDMIDKKPFFIRPFTVKEDMKSKIDKEMDRLVKFRNIKERLIRIFQPSNGYTQVRIVASQGLLEISDISIKG